MYRIIETTIWSDPKVKKLNPFEKLLFYYLITSPHALFCVIFYISLETIQAETAITMVDLKKAFLRLATISDFEDLDTLSIPYQYPIDGDSRSGLAFYDEHFQVVWVRNMLKIQGRGEKVKKGVENHLLTLHKCPLINCLRDYYAEIGWGVIDTPSIPYGIPHRYKEQEQDQKQDQKKQQQHEKLSHEKKKRNDSTLIENPVVVSSDWEIPVKPIDYKLITAVEAQLADGEIGDMNYWEIG